MHCPNCGATIYDDKASACPTCGSALAGQQPFSAAEGATSVEAALRRMMLEQCGLMGMIGKADRGDLAVESIKKNKSVYLMAVGGAAYLVSKAIKKARVLAFEDLGMEAIREFVVEDMPVTVAVDSEGNNIHKIGPAKWKDEIQRLNFKYID